MKRLTSAQVKAKQLLENTAKKIDYFDSKVEDMDISVFFEQCSYGKNQNTVACELLEHIREFGRHFL